MKAVKGSVSISVVDGRFRLRWQGVDSQGKPKRFTLAAGAENNVNRIAAERLAREIELDLASGNFDPTLRKYKKGVDSQNSLTIAQLCDRYVNVRIRADQSSSIERYKTLKNHLLNCFRDLTVEDCDDRKAAAFVRYLCNLELAGDTTNLYLTLCRAVWNWGQKKGYVRMNPWLDLKVETQPKPPAKPFSTGEVAKILTAFEESYYHNFVRFLLGAGCRIGEAAALRWDAVSDDCSEVWFGRAWDAKGKRVKPTKTNRTRTVPVSPGIQALLQQLKQSADSELVFPSPKGGFMDRANFRKRHWKPTLERLGIEYRSTYNSRHTRWSHEIAKGMDIAIAARYAGNRPRTMMDRYLGATDRPRLKDFD
jgi:integrase